MSLRTFSVFVDSPERTTSSVKRDASSALTMLSPTLTSSNALEQLLSPTGEKENVHPLTGLASSFQPNKKRKTSSSVLSVKEQLVPQESKSSKLKGSEGPRKRSSSSASVGKSKSKGSKDRKVLGSSTNASSSGSSRSRGLKPSATLPIFLDSVTEERSFEVAETIAQAEINSRCYDLTVTPLADVSEAYLGPSSQACGSSQSQTLTQNSEATEFESTLNEYFSNGFGLPKVSTVSKLASTSESKSPQSQGFTIFRDTSTSPKVARKITRTVSAPLIFFREDDDKKEPREAPCGSPVERPSIPAFTFSSPARSPQQ